MPTDDERRRVARKLREYASWDGEEDCFVDCADWGERVLNLLYRDGEDHTEGEYYARLADLIEPGEPKVKCVAEVKIDGERLEQLVHDAAVELTGIDRDSERTCRMVDCGSHDTCVVNRELSNGNIMSMEFGYKQCSECGANVFDCPTVRYCPNCGARIEGDYDE